MLDNDLLFISEQIFREGDVDLVRVTINKGIVDLNIKDEEGMTVLQKAAQEGHVALVKALLACGAEPQLPMRRKAGNGPSTVNENLVQDVQEILKRTISDKTMSSGNEGECGKGHRQAQKRKQPDQTQGESEDETQNKEMRLE